jgi:hypothetical protein
VTHKNDLSGSTANELLSMRLSQVWLAPPLIEAAGVGRVRP